jgi:hypothetical protein
VRGARWVRVCVAKGDVNERSARTAQPRPPALWCAEDYVEESDVRGSMWEASAG